MDMGLCRCSFSNGELKRIGDTSPSLWYCVEACNAAAGSSGCRGNTACSSPLGDNSYRCYCSTGSTLSSTGQCVGKAPTTTKTVGTSQDVNTGSTTPFNREDRKQEDLCQPQDNSSVNSSQTLTTGLAAGMGVAILMAFVLAVALVWRIRLFKTPEKCECYSSVRQAAHSQGNASSTVELGCSYKNVVSSSLPGESRASRRPGQRVEREAEVQETDAQQKSSVGVPENDSPNSYVKVPSESPYNHDTSGLYEFVNTPDTSEIRLYATLSQT